MRSDTVLTLVNKNGAKSYRLTNTGLLLFAVLGGLFLFMIIGAGLVIYSQHAQINQFGQYSQNLNTQIEEANFKNVKLAENFDNVNQRLNDILNINEIISLEESTDEKPGYFQINHEESQGKALSYQPTINYNKHSLRERTFVLMNIPNGNPLINSFYYVSSAFGYRSHPILNRRMFHSGLDMAVPIGTKVHATANGIVSFVGPNSGFGKLIKITHNYGFTTYYAHLDAFNVKVGDVVTKGQIIALSGNTGRSTGPHLHYEVRYLNKPLSPKTFIDWDYANQYHTVFEKEKSVQWNQILTLINQVIPAQASPSYLTSVN